MENKMTKLINSLFSLFIKNGFIIKLANSNLVDVEYPQNDVENVEEHAYVFVPVATIVGFCVVGVCLLLLVGAKIMFASSDQYMVNNPYDLVIYKQVTSKAHVQHKQTNTNSANAHNLNAAVASNFDITLIRNRKSFKAVFQMPHDKATKTE